MGYAARARIARQTPTQTFSEKVRTVIGRERKLPCGCWTTARRFKILTWLRLRRWLSLHDFLHNRWIRVSS